MKEKTVISWLIWLIISLFFQDGTAQRDHFYFNHLTQTDGLSQTTNNVVFKDSRGFVWISSLNGLNRYDGREIKVYKYRAGDPHSLPDNYIQSRFVEDGDGNIWFTTHEALVCYVRKYDRFDSYRDSTAEGQPRLGYHLSFMHEGKLWVVIGQSDFYQFNPDSKSWDLKQVLTGKAQRVIPVFDNKNGLSGLITGSYDEPGLHFYDFKISGNENHQLHFAGVGNEPPITLSDAIWIGDTLLVAANEGFLKCAKNGSPWFFYPTPDWRPNKLTLTKDGEIFVSLNGGGWLVLDYDNIPSGRQYLHNPNDPLSLSSNVSYGIWEDDDGGVWTGATGRGVDFAQPKKVKFDVLDIGKRFGIEGRAVGIHAMTEDMDGNIWCSSRTSGVFKLTADLQPLTHFTKLNKNGNTLSVSDVPYLFLDKKGRCWALTYYGLFMKEPEGKRFDLINNHGFLYGLELKNEKGLLFTTFTGGISVLRESEGGFHFEKIPHVDTLSPFTHLYQNRKGLVLANKNLQSILVLDPDNGFAIMDEWPIKGDVHAYFEEPDSDTIWIGTKNGLTSLNQKDPNSCVTYTEEDGLPDQEIYAIIGDDSTLWLTTNRGMVRFFKKEKRFHTFDLYDGMQGLEFNSHGFMQRRNGEVWLAGQRGINYFKPSDILPLRIAPKVQISGMWVNDERRQDLECAKTGATNVSEIKQLSFRPDERKFRFEFAALEFSNPARNTFRYKLENYDKGWSQWTRENFAIYNRLPPGDYTLLVSTANSDGFEAKEFKQLAFTIQAPFWQHWWFIVLMVLALFAMSYAVYRYRLAQLLHIERLRNQISTDLHDDIGATLSNVNILTTLVRQKLPINSDALPLFARIEEEVQASAESLDDIIWSINPKNDPLDRVLARMRRFASEVFEAKGIEGVLHFPKEARHLRLDMDKRRQFYLLFKEAVNNLAKYAACKRAEITVAYQNGQLTMTVQDDGVGFDVTAVGDGRNGLSTMRQRAANLKGKYHIHSVPGQGTSVNVVFPITEIRD